MKIISSLNLHNINHYHLQ